MADRGRNLRCMRLEREVAGIEELNDGAGNIAPERLRTGRQKEGIVLSPHRQQVRLMSAEGILEGRVKRDVALVVAEQVQLNLVGAGPGQVEVVERIAVRGN